MSVWRSSLGGVAVAALALTTLALPATASSKAATARTITAASTATTSHPASTTTPELWPKLSPFQTLVVAHLTGATSDQQLAATTLEGAYNQLQGTNRLYVVQSADDQTWLTDHVLH